MLTITYPYYISGISTVIYNYNVNKKPFITSDMQV